MKRSVYRSCGCFSCRHAGSGAKGTHKRLAHRRFRRQGRRDPGNIVPVSTGYIA